jgi:glycosyltransferase involved in cell wall biosynthesis
MKILIVTDAWEPQVNGVVRTLKMTQRELAKIGHEVVFLTPQDFKSVPCPTYPEISLALTTGKKVKAHIESVKPDCLHIATEGPLGWIARGVAIEKNWPFTTAYHSRFPEYVNARFRIPTSWTYALLRSFHNKGAFNLTPTPAIVEDLRSRGFKNPRLWTRGVDKETFTPVGNKFPRPSDKPVFLHVGRLAVEKNVDEFLKLDLPGEKWVAGDGPERARLEKTYKDIRWFGVLDGLTLASLYRSADVFVFPSVTDTFGLVMLEAMSCGTPVAAYPVPGPIDVVQDQVSGALNKDLQLACLKALEISRTDVYQHSLNFSWEKASLQFLSALQPFKS